MVEYTFGELIIKGGCMLKELRDDDSDEIPKERICSMDKDNRYKVRGAWWERLELTRWILGFGGLLSESLDRDFKKLYTNYWDNQARYNNRTQPQDIEAANSWINSAISSLYSRLGAC